MSTDLTHAGNEDRLRDVQLVKLPRCEMCHYHLGQFKDGSPVILRRVNFDDPPIILLCTGCIEAGTFENGQRRTLPADCQAANEAFIEGLEDF